MDRNLTPFLYPGISTVADGTCRIFLLVKYPGVHLVGFPILVPFSILESSFFISDLFLFLLVPDEEVFPLLSSSDSESILLVLLPTGLFGLAPLVPGSARSLVDLSSFSTSVLAPWGTPVPCPFDLDERVLIPELPTVSCFADNLLSDVFLGVTPAVLRVREDAVLTLVLPTVPCFVDDLSVRCTFRCHTCHTTGT